MANDQTRKLTLGDRQREEKRARDRATDAAIALSMGYGMRREAQPVECDVCDWRGRRIVARSAPCPSCGSRVNFR